MSGHSKWSQIKRQKGAADVKRGTLFTKLGNAVALAARGGADPEKNFKLRLAIERARAVNMPRDTIDRAIARGAGTAGDTVMHEVTYEGFGPGNVAILIEAATDNKNRTVASLRGQFDGHGGRLADVGSVAWQFAHRGVISIDAAPDAELFAIDAGAEDVVDADGALTVYTAPDALAKVRAELVARGLSVRDATLSYVPKTTIEVADADADRLAALLNALEDEPDVANVYHNAAT